MTFGGLAQFSCHVIDDDASQYVVGSTRRKRDDEGYRMFRKMILTMSVMLRGRSATARLSAHRLTMAASSLIEWLHSRRSEQGAMTEECILVR
jgi:hypothetical protein